MVSAARTGPLLIGIEGRHVLTIADGPWNRFITDSTDSLKGYHPLSFSMLY